MYIDTSLLVPCYTPEVDTNRAIATIKAAPRCVISDLTLTEMHVAIIRKGKRGDMTQADVALALSRLDDHISNGVYTVAPCPREVFTAAWQITQKVVVHLRTLDALHLAMAQRLGLPLGTLDRDLAKAAQEIAVETRP